MNSCKKLNKYKLSKNIICQEYEEEIKDYIDSKHFDTFIKLNNSIPDEINLKK